MRAVAASLALVCLLAAAVAPASAVHDTGQTVEVFLESDGDATLTTVTTYNLSVADDRERFESLRDNATAREQRVSAFTERLERGMRAVREGTDREPAVGDAGIRVESANGTGTVTLSAPVPGLAAVEGRAVVLTRPFGTEAFALGADETLVVRGPQGYVRGPLRPEPDIARRNSAFWGGGTDLSGFAARFERPPTPTPTPDGWGAFSGAAFVALVPTLLVAAAVLQRSDGEAE